VVEDNVVFEDGAIVFPGKRIASGYRYAGLPAKPVRPLREGEAAEAAEILRRRDIGRERGIPARSRPSATSQIDESVFVAATATVKGRIVAARNASIFFSNDLDAGDAVIRIGENSNIQDNTIIRCTTAQGFAIGRNSTIGHNVLLYDCTIGDNSLIGIGTIVARGSVIGNRVLLAAGARTAEGQVLEDGWLYAGTPAKKLAELDRAKDDMIAFAISSYCQYAPAYKKAQEALERVS
jgi:carbonic anhydrase/acetyltransferase-like protein (isoleucine patch superfamily)